MIPNNIDRRAVIAAIEKIDENGIPRNRSSRTYNLKFNGRFYPPKYVVSVANIAVNGSELHPGDFGGGAETNTFLEKLGFEIVPSNHETDLQDNDTNIQVRIVTAVIENQNGRCPENKERLNFMAEVIDQNRTEDIILFPAGYFYFDQQRSDKIISLCSSIANIISKADGTCTVCVGIDCDDGADQLAVAVNRDGIRAMGRKFYPTGDEDGYIRAAGSYDEAEMGYSRKFCVKGKNVYLAVCYDSFGIRHCNLPDLNIDIVLVLAHQFWKCGKGPSGDVDFVRKGFAGASQHWQCPVFGTAVFFCREIPENWPTGVLWTDRSKSVRHFKYHENLLSWVSKKEIFGHAEKAVCYNYRLTGHKYGR